MKICTYMTRKNDATPWIIDNTSVVEDDHVFGANSAGTGIHVEGAIAVGRMEKSLTINYYTGHLHAPNDYS